jgi:hypothetical protein
MSFDLDSNEIQILSEDKDEEGRPLYSVTVNPDGLVTSINGKYVPPEAYGIWIPEESTATEED